MKKSFLVLAAALSLGLAACGNQPAPSGPSVPTEAGKVTFYFEMAENEAAVEVPEYCNVFLTGAFAGWKTAVGEAVTMQPLEEGSNIWYGQWEGDYTTIADKGYQLTIGYSATSGAPSTGVNWSYKSAECQEGSGDSGVENLEFVLSEDGLTANLGSHHWEEKPGPVVLAENVTVSIKLSEAVPTYATIYMPGSLTGWKCDANDAMTPSTDRKTWTKTFAVVAVNNYEIKVLAEYTKAYDNDKVKFGWNAILDDGTEGHGNYSLNVLRGDANHTINLNEKANEGEDFEFDWSKLPDPALFIKLNFKVEFGAALADTLTTWYAIGNFNGWAALDEWKFEIASDKKSMTVSGFGPKEADIEFGICVDSNWSTCLKMIKADESLGNFAVKTLAAECTITITVTAEVVAQLNAAAGEYGASVAIA